MSHKACCDWSRVISLLISHELSRREIIWWIVSSISTSFAYMSTLDGRYDTCLVVVVTFLTIIRVVNINYWYMISIFVFIYTFLLDILFTDALLHPFRLIVVKILNINHINNSKYPLFILNSIIKTDKWYKWNSDFIIFAATRKRNENISLRTI